MAARIQEAEADVENAQAQLDRVQSVRAAARERLAGKQDGTVRLTAALQAMSRQPAILSLVQPGTIADAVHVRAALDASMPELRARTATLYADLDRSNALAAAARSALARQQLAARTLNLRRASLDRIVRLESQKLGAAGVLARAEQERAALLGDQARDLAGLIADADATAEVTARLESLPGPVLRPNSATASPWRSAQAETPGSPRHAVYRLPARGRVVTGFGERSGAGLHSRGLTLATAPLAQVVAPAGGRIVFAGPFRDYGRLVIIDHGRGWTSVITDLSRLDVAVGDRVQGGSPLGRTRPAAATMTVELRRRGQPVDIARLVG